jgi:glucan phosphoethanolaminetransferase (alkaline phosphatase superfamily)
MQNNTEKRRSALRSAAVLVLVLAAFAALLVLLLVRVALGEPVAMAFLIWYALVLLAVLVGVLLALRQRLRELATGEEDKAKKY